MAAHLVSEAEEEAAEKNDAEEDAEYRAGAEGELAVGWRIVFVVEKRVHWGLESQNYGAALVTEVKADHGFVRGGVLEDGEVVLAEVGSEEEGLAEAGAQDTARRRMLQPRTMVSRRPESSLRCPASPAS